MGFSQTGYSFNEDDGGVVCVILLNGTIQSRNTIITLTLNATEGSANGILKHTHFYTIVILYTNTYECVYKRHACIPQ